MRARRYLLAVVAAVLLFAACSSDSNNTASSNASASSSAAPAPTTIQVQAGINDPSNKTIAVLQYMPGTVTVPVNTPVNWSWEGAIEPHSVTFLKPGQQLPAPGSDTSLFAPTPPTGPYDGSTFVNSGLFPLAPGPVPPFTMTFSKTGTYEYHCVIHPQMVGKVDVVDAGAKSDTPQEVQDRGNSEKQQWIAEGESAAQHLSNTPATSTTNPDGTKTWTVLMGASTQHTDVLAFSPSPDIKAGDKVTFLNNSSAPHTATFSGNTPQIQNPLDPRTEPPAPGPSPQTLNATDFFNTGELPPNAPPGAGPPEAARSFTFTVPTAGNYSYYCILHVSSGMGSALTVS
jgi:plastocyanin